MTPSENIDIFQERRHRWFSGIILCGILVGLAVLGGLIYQSYEVTFYFGLLTFGVWVYTTWRYYRCPNCQTIPSAGDGISFNPLVCETCGLPLRRDNGEQA